MPDRGARARGRRAGRAQGCERAHGGGASGRTFRKAVARMRRASAEEHVCSNSEIVWTCLSV